MKVQSNMRFKVFWNFFQSTVKFWKLWRGFVGCKTIINDNPKTRASRQIEMSCSLFKRKSCVTTSDVKVAFLLQTRCSHFLFRHKSRVPSSKARVAFPLQTRRSCSLFECDSRVSTSPRAYEPRVGHEFHVFAIREIRISGTTDSHKTGSVTTHLFT